MTIKKLLGLELSLQDEIEMVRRIQEVQQKKTGEIELVIGEKKVKVRLS